MVISHGTMIRPHVAADYRTRSSQRKMGLYLMVLGLMIGMVAFISSLVQAGSDGSVVAQAAWTFGVATAALGTIKTGIAVILWGTVRWLWIRIQGIKESLPKLVSQSTTSVAVHESRISTPYGAGQITKTAPSALPIHRIAYALWLPMLLMGVMGLLAGLVLSFVEAQAFSDGDTDTFNVLRSLVPSIEFFGEALLLAGISFLLGSILGSLRQGGGEVQESLGVGVKSLLMPVTAKLFVGLMVMGMMVEMIQLGFYIYVSTLSDEATISAYHAWLGPLREAGLGLLLSGIVLAMGTIGTVLGFQFDRIFDRIKELITTGR